MIGQLFRFYKTPVALVKSERFLSRDRAQRIAVPDEHLQLGKICWDNHDSLVLGHGFKITPRRAKLKGLVMRDAGLSRHAPEKLDALFDLTRQSRVMIALNRRQFHF